VPFARSLDSLGCAVLGLDSHGAIRYANQRLLSWTGYAFEELAGRSVACLAPPELDEILDKELRAVDQGDLRARLTILRRKDSTTFPVIVLPQHQRYDEPEAFHCAVVIDLACMQTAKPANLPHTAGLRSSLARITRELEALALLADAASPASSTTSVLDHPRLASLSPREREVVSHLLRGLRVGTIARTLHISPHTVRNHLKAIFQKVGVSSQDELARVVDMLRTANA